MLSKVLSFILVLVPFYALADVTVDPAVNPTVELTCTLPIEREDNTPITIDEISHLNFYWGTTVGDYQNMDTSTTCSLVVNVAERADGPYHYVATAVDTDGRESTYSVMYTITVLRTNLVPPLPPQGLKVTITL